MPKFFVKNEQIEDNKIKIIGEDVNHIVNVLRMKNGEEINICDVDNSINYLSKITNFSKDEVICQIMHKLAETSESNVSITIFQGLPKFDKMELIIQKATEIGVKKIVPVSMKRCVVKLNNKDISKKVERWQKIAEIASKQSMRDYIPKIDNIATIGNIIEKFKEYDLILVAYENEKQNLLKNELKKLKDKNEYCNIGIVIGPEGGIDKQEIDEFKKNENVRMVSLGKRILRTETAGLVMSSNIIYEFEN